MNRKNSHCSYCGQGFVAQQPWPRTCRRCERISYLNPLPVAVAVLPVDDGVLCIRRDIEPGRGQLALPGGFMEIHESWQQAAARELFEEAQIVIDPTEFREVRVLSTFPPDGYLLIFGVARHRTLAELPPFQVNSEASERVVVRQAVPLAFPLHTQVLLDYFEQRLGRP